MAKRRGNGEGSIFKEKTGKRWIGEIYLGIKPNGKPDKRKVYGKTRKDAAEKLNKLISEHHQGRTLTPEKTTLEQYISVWLKDKKRNVKPTEYSCRIRPAILRHPGTNPVTSGQSSYHIRPLFLQYPANKPAPH